MMIALFQTHFVLIKIAVTVSFILLGVPLIAWLSRQLGDEDKPIAVETPGGFDAGEHHSSWQATIVSSTSELLGNLWFIIRISVPLMLLAGLLGATVMELVSFEELAVVPITNVEILVLD